MITNILTVANIGSTVDDVGGKGAGLYKLSNTYHSSFYRVPKTLAVRCEHSFKRGFADVQGLSAKKKYAVRSSAPMSMPGMMETLLNVEYKDLQSAIEKVWDSYNSEHCVQYRTDNNIPDKGVAVLIQEMVNADIAGVVFTTDPNSAFNKGTFEPTIEYVQGLGDKLVGGTEMPEKMATNHKNYEAIVSAAKFCFTKWQDCDIEFAVAGNDVFLLQVRPLVFSKASLAEVDSAAGEFIGKGLSIASDGVVTGKLVTEDYASEPLADSILYVSNFEPKTYPLMVKAKAIITAVGGKHCHAAIVGRQMGKIVISNVELSTISQYLGKRIMLAAPAGVICTVMDGASTDHHNVLAKPILIQDVPENHKIPAVKAMQTWCKDNVYGIVVAREYAARFYQKYADYIADHTTLPIVQEEVNRSAMMIASYYYAICAGEARHTGNLGFRAVDEDTRDEDNLTYLLARKHLKTVGYTLTTADETGREAFLSHRLYQPKTLAEAIETMTAIDNVFRFGAWLGAMAGKKWAVISSLWLQFAKGEIPAYIFLDMAFNKAHNSGNIFGKYGWCPKDNQLLAALNARREGDLAKMVREAFNTITDPDKVSAELAKTSVSDERYAELLSAVSPAKEEVICEPVPEAAE